VYAEWFDLRSGDPVLGIAPFSHITGSVACLAVGIVTGAPMIMLHRFDAAEVLRLVEKWRPAFTVAASTAYLALANHPSAASRDLSSVTKAASGGAPVTAALVQDVRRRLGWELNGVYGLTETTSPTHLTPPGATVPVDPETGALAVGIPVPGVRVRLLDLDSGLDCAAGEAGEIAVRGPMVIAGYWNAPAESAHAIRDGWLYTGDVGVMNELGWLWVVDRKKDLINASGFKVWPGEVEEVLAGHPAVLESVVVGVPDPYRGETVKAFVVLRDGMTAEPAALVAFCRDRLAAYKYPRLVEFVEILPKTASGKVLRRTLRDKPAQ